MKNRGMGIALSYVNTFLNMVFGLFLSSYMLRMLGNTEYGIYQTVGSFAYYLVLLEFGTGTVLTRNIAMSRARNEDKNSIEKNISTIWSITCILAIAIIVASAVFYIFIDKIYASSMTASQIAYGKNIFIFISIYLVISFLTETLNGIPVAFEDYSFIPKLSIAKAVIRTSLLIVLIIYIRYVIIAAIIDMVLSIASFILEYIYCKKAFSVAINCKKFDLSILKSSLPLCLAIFIQVIVNQANSNVDKFVIGVKMNPESVAIYSVGLYVYNAFSSLTTIPISMYGPQVAKDVVNGLEGKELTDRMISPSRIISLIGGLVLFGFIAVGQQFISIIYGPQYLIAWVIALIIMIPMYINMANGILINVLDAKNKRMSRSFALLITTVANIILTVIWIDIWGIVGAALATFVCTIVGQILIMNIYYSKVIGIKVIYMYIKTFKGILVFLILGAAASVLIGKFINNVYISFIICSIIFILIACGGYLLFGANSIEKEMISKLKQKVLRIGK